MYSIIKEWFQFWVRDNSLLSWILTTLLTGFRIWWLHLLQKGNTPLPPQKKCYPGYGAKLHLMVRLKFWRSREGGVAFMAITPRSTLTQRFVVSVKVSSLSQIDVSKLFMFSKILRIVYWSDNCLLRITISYLKPYECVQIIWIRQEYLISYNHIQKRPLKKQQHKI